MREDLWSARRAITESVQTEGELIMMLIMPSMMHDVLQIRAHDATCARQLVAVWTAHTAGRTVERRMLDNNRSALSYASSPESGNLDRRSFLWLRASVSLRKLKN